MAIIFGMVSCAPQKDTTIAIDVLLIPSEEMYTQALQLNSKINANNPKTIKLDENHVPHITLLQGYIKETDLWKVTKALNSLYENIAQDSLKAESFFYDHKKEESFAMVRIEKSKPLLQLHEKTIKLVKPYLIKNGSGASFVQNPDNSPISNSTVHYVSNFIAKHGHENYDPHISLGVAQKKVLDSLAERVFKPIHFKASSLSVYHLGDHGTAQKLLWKSE